MTAVQMLQAAKVRLLTRVLRGLKKERLKKRLGLSLGPFFGILVHHFWSAMAIGTSAPQSLNLRRHQPSLGLLVDTEQRVVARHQGALQWLGDAVMLQQHSHVVSLCEPG